MQFHWHSAKSTGFGQKGKETDAWHGLCHVAERQYWALIKLLHSQILSRIRCCFNYHDVNRMRKVERVTPGTRWHLSGVGNWICTTAAGFICCSKSSERSIRVFVEHVFDVSASPSLHTGAVGYIVKQGWCDRVFFLVFFVCWEGCIV